MGLWAWLNLPLPRWPHNPYSRYEMPQVVRLYRLRHMRWFTVDNSFLQEGECYVTREESMLVEFISLLFLVVVGYTGSDGVAITV